MHENSFPQKMIHDGFFLRKRLMNIFNPQNVVRYSEVKLRVFTSDGFFPCPPFYFSIYSKTMIDRDLHSFASFSWRFELVLPPYFICVRQPEVTGKPEVNRKTVRTARWCDIFIFSNMPYPDEKRWYCTQNDAFNLILKSDFDLGNKKCKKLTFSFTAYDL